MTETAYRTSPATIEIEELRKRNEKLERENSRYRKTLSLVEQAKSSWEDSRVAGMVFRCLLAALTVCLFLAAVSEDTDRDLAEARAIEAGVATLQTNKVRARCVANTIEDTEDWTCLIQAQPPQQTLAFACNENRCVALTLPR